MPPGTTKGLINKTGKRIAFSPEYIGDPPEHPRKEEDDCGFMIVGGEAHVADLVISAYKTVAVPRLRYARTDSTTAELCKYMENCYLATKVAYVNQFAAIAQHFDVQYDELRSLWLLDKRIGESHTVVKDTGFGGRCLPKDLRAIIATMKPYGGAPLLEAVLEYNDTVRLPKAVAR